MQKPNPVIKNYILSSEPFVIKNKDLLKIIQKQYFGQKLYQKPINTKFR